MASAEALLISAVVRTGDILTPIKEGVTPDLFNGHRHEWEFISDYYLQHRKAPSKTLFRRKFPKFRVEEVDDTDYLCEDVKREYARRSLIETLQSSAEDLSDEADPLEVANRYANALVSIQNTLSGHKDEIDLVADWEDVYKVAHARWERRQHYGLPGVPTGFQIIDHNTGGIGPGEYWVIAARLGEGKTWTGIRMAAAALDAGLRVQYDALEMTKAQTAFRMHTFLSSKHAKEVFSNSDLTLGKGYNLLDYKEWLKALAEDEEFTGAMFISDTGRGRVTAQKIASQIERNSPDVVFIDYLTLMDREDGWEGVQKLSGEIKNVAMQYDVPIVVLAQVNRGGINRTSKEPPRTEHLAGSDAIGQDADAVITMAKQSDNVMRLRMAKYRHGVDGYQWYAKFIPNTGVYEEITGDEATKLIDIDLEDQPKVWRP